MESVLVFVGAGVLVLGLIVWAGHRMLTTGGGAGGGGASDALGNFIDVFDPARSRADQDLKSKEHQGEVAPVPDDDDRPMVIDPVRMRVTVRRAAPTPPSGPPAPRGQQPPPAGR
jgi:hypothetical protein